MYRKDDNRKLAEALQRIDARLETLEALLRDAPPGTESGARQPRGSDGADGQAEDGALVRDLTRMQYELSNELFAGVVKLKRLIAEGEGDVVAAKGQYRK